MLHTFFIAMRLSRARRARSAQKATSSSKTTQQRKKSKPEHLRDKLSGEALVGAAPVEAALRAGKRSIRALYLQENQSDARGQRFRQLANERGVSVYSASKSELSLAAGGSVHQGFLADASELQFTHIHSVPAPHECDSSNVFICLDEVQDPRNFVRTHPKSSRVLKSSA